MISYLLNKLNNNIITLEQYYSYNITENIKLLNNLKNNNFFDNDKYKNYEYTKKQLN